MKLDLLMILLGRSAESWRRVNETYPKSGFKKFPTNWSCLNSSFSEKNNMQSGKLMENQFAFLEDRKWHSKNEQEFQRFKVDKEGNLR